MIPGSRSLAARSKPARWPTKVLLLGATGFIGSRILQALQARDDNLVSILARRSTGLVSEALPGFHLGDVTDKESVSRAVSRADVVINASSYVGSEQSLARQVNQEGTMSVIRACEDSHVRRLIQISTTAVYGSGPHRALLPWEAPYRPDSAASRSRAAADRAVLSAGGIVIRPNLIHGIGDRWFIPGAVDMFRALGTDIENGRARLSMIDVVDLGRLVASLAVTAFPVAGAFHATDPVPVTLARLLGTISRHVRPLDLAGSSSLEEAVRTLEPAGFRPHQVHMLGMDHHYEAQDLWNLSGLQPSGFHLTPETAAWYRAEMSVRLSGMVVVRPS
ncbi:NAD-dependent epimerase/dehydratase family protein (plasmid) [Pseudarthrobacter sp. O4]|uniref:NAD-dependent epimerase/dehydratase family protein n=1 Tax=Pseudarthrobacter sp. O4 TaxID=3418417 RepID=UPI003CF995CF